MLFGMVVGFGSEVGCSVVGSTVVGSTVVGSVTGSVHSVTDSVGFSVAEPVPVVAAENDTVNDDIATIPTQIIEISFFKSFPPFYAYIFLEGTVRYLPTFYNCIYISLMKFFLSKDFSVTVLVPDNYRAVIFDNPVDTVSYAFE